MTGDRRKQHNVEFHKLNSSKNIIRMTKSKAMRWKSHVAGIQETRNAYKILVLKGSGHSEDISVCGKKILKWILGKYGGSV
jgi:hypothetical protein